MNQLFNNHDKLVTVCIALLQEYLGKNSFSEQCEAIKSMWKGEGKEIMNVLLSEQTVYKLKSYIESTDLIHLCMGAYVIHLTMKICIGINDKRVSS